MLPDDAPCRVHITQGRHPVLDALHPGSMVPNDVHLDVCLWGGGAWDVGWGGWVVHVRMCCMNTQVFGIHVCLMCTCA